MSKKLIAVASAAALALSALVAMPASAAAFGVTVEGEFGSTTGTTATGALVVNAPSQDVLRFDDDAASITGTVLRFQVTSTAAGASVTATATDGVKLLTPTQVGASEVDLPDLTSASGTSSVSVTTDSEAVAYIYAYSTSTTAGTITFGQTGSANSQLVYVKAQSLKSYAYKLNFTATNTSSAASGDITFSGTVTDAFGNLLTVETADLVVNGIGGDLGSPVAQKDFAQNSTTKIVTFAVANRSTVGTAALQVNMHTTLAPLGVPAKITAFGDPVATQFFAVNALDLSAQVASLTAQVAALQATIADMRTKARSVTLKRWNDLVLRHRALGGSAKLK